MEEQVEAAASPLTSRRHFLDLLLGASILGWLASIAYPSSAISNRCRKPSDRADPFDPR
jgi:hypothetical protein